MKKGIWIILGILFFGNLFFRVYLHRSDYVTPFNFDYWKNLYKNSQWTTTKACTNLDPHVNPYTCIWDDNWYAHHKNDPNVIFLKKHAIGDDALYTYAGWEYVHGHDPTTLNAEIPPLGKYLIGLSELIFHNQYFFALGSSLFALGAFFLLNIQLLKNKLMAFMPVVAFSFDPLFYSQLHIMLLDSLYLGFLMMNFYFFIQKRFIFSAVLLGLMAATKSSLSSFLLVIGVQLVYLVYSKQKKVLKHYFLTLPIAFIVFCLTYLKYFLDGHSLRSFLGVQKWIYVFYATGAKGSHISPWDMIFFGKWHTWWGTDATFYRWHMGWPVLMLLFVLSIYLMLRRRYKKPLSLLVIWNLAYLAFLTFIPTWPRYLLLCLPFLYTLSIWVIVQWIAKSKYHKLVDKEKYV